MIGPDEVDILQEEFSTFIPAFKKKCKCSRLFAVAFQFKFQFSKVSKTQKHKLITFYAQFRVL